MLYIRVVYGKCLIDVNQCLRMTLFNNEKLISFSNSSSFRDYNFII